MAGGTDPGRENIGDAVVTERGKVVYLDHVKTRNKDIPKLMQERNAHRRARHRGTRLVKKRRAKKHGTLSSQLDNGRLLPGCKEPLQVKDIVNAEARFLNRKRPEGWITPTVRQLVQTHLNHVDQIRKILPMTSWCLEANKFAFMKMEDETVQGIDFQNGRLKGYESKEAYVSDLQNGKCACCDKKIAHFHHLVPRSGGGSDTPENIVGLCEDCHTKVHTGKLSLNEIGLKKKYAHLSVLNQAIPYIIEGLIERFGEENVFLCEGKEAKALRDIYSFEKDHYLDAACIASIRYELSDIEEFSSCHEVIQYRRHDRAIVKSQRERTYYLDGKVMAKNRKPRFEQSGSALSDLKLDEETISRLTAKKSRRYYNDLHRQWHPGDKFFCDEKLYVMTGQLSNGTYLRAYGEDNRNFPVKKCLRYKFNQGLVYVA